MACGSAPPAWNNVAGVTAISTSDLPSAAKLVPGLKHEAALSVAYGAGLRTNEVVLLKVSNIDSTRMVIRVEQGEWRKDRYVMLSPNLLELRRACWRAARPQGCLFPGQDQVKRRASSTAHLASNGQGQTPYRACVFSTTRRPGSPRGRRRSLRGPGGSSERGGSALRPGPLSHEWPILRNALRCTVAGYRQGSADISARWQESLGLDPHTSPGA
jgi:integrase